MPRSFKGTEQTGSGRGARPFASLRTRRGPSLAMSASPRTLQCSRVFGPYSGPKRWQRTPQVRLWLAWVLLAVAIGAACSADVAGAAGSNPLGSTDYTGELIELPRDSLSWTDGHSAQLDLAVAGARAQKLQWRSWRQRRFLQQAPGTPDGACGVLTFFTPVI